MGTEPAAWPDENMTIAEIVYRGASVRTAFGSAELTIMRCLNVMLKLPEPCSR